jgi:REP element-mobilizing transposase RayT
MGAQLTLAAVKRRPARNGARWGGRREGAGRKPKNGVKAGVAHVRREGQGARVPMHVTLRVAKGVPRLRQRRGYQVVRRALGRANRLEGARICEVSIQANHLHLIVEADDRASLTRLMRSFAITAAKGVNARFGRRGRVVEDRYHVVRLTTPAQVRSALAYVLGNWRRHGEDRDGLRCRTDRYSSGPFFGGWTVPAPPCIRIDDLPFPEDGALPIRFARSWLLREGWKRHGLITPWVRPGPIAA